MRLSWFAVEVLLLAALYITVRSSRAIASILCKKFKSRESAHESVVMTAKIIKLRISRIKCVTYVFIYVRRRRRRLIAIHILALFNIMNVWIPIKKKILRGWVGSRAVYKVVVIKLYIFILRRYIENVYIFFLLIITIKIEFFVWWWNCFEFLQNLMYNNAYRDGSFDLLHSPPPYINNSAG